LGFGQVQRVFVIRCLDRVGAHWERPLDDLVVYWIEAVGAKSQTPLPGVSRYQSAGDIIRIMMAIRSCMAALI
uniref:hypothetical protein n=1 Tax=uncultured Ruegeria sp. TaxID=259304 RepID=UPI00261EACE7